MLTIENLSIQYGSSPPAVKDFSLTVKRGEIVCIVGESGSGKSSVIRCIMGLMHQSAKVISGDVILEGESLVTCPPSRWSSLRGERMSMIFQDLGNTLNPVRRIGPVFVEYIRTHKKMSKKDAWTLACHMLEKMRLADCETIMKSYPFQLSGGMRQRVSIAMAMTFKPELLLADEPTSALDVTTQAQIVAQMMELRSTYGSSIIMVTHNIGVAAYMADHIIVMKDGDVMEQGNPKEIVNNPQQAYTKALIESVPDLVDFTDMEAKDIG